MSNQGILHRFQQKAIPLFKTPKGTKFEPVIGEQVVQMHFILFFGIFVSIAIAALEICLKKRSCNQKNHGNGHVYVE